MVAVARAPTVFDNPVEELPRWRRWARSCRGRCHRAVDLIGQHAPAATALLSLVAGAVRRFALCQRSAEAARGRIAGVSTAPAAAVL